MGHRALNYKRPVLGRWVLHYRFEWSRCLQFWLISTGWEVPTVLRMVSAVRDTYRRRHLRKIRMKLITGDDRALRGSRNDRANMERTSRCHGRPLAIRERRSIAIIGIGAGFHGLSDVPRMKLAIDGIARWRFKRPSLTWVAATPGIVVQLPFPAARRGKRVDREPIEQENTGAAPRRQQNQFVRITSVRSFGTQTLPY